MAKVNNPALSLSASGTLGAINYTVWRGQPIARAKTTLVCPMTTPQEKAQDAVTTASQGWSGTLTEAQRGYWEEFAKSQQLVNRLGNHYRPTGYLMYMKRSVQALLLGGGILTKPSLDAHDTIPSTMSVIASPTPGEADLDFSFPAGGETPDLVQVFRAGPYDGAGRKPIAPEFLEVQQIATPFSWTDTGLTSSKYYWYRVRWGWTDGVVSTPHYFQVLVV